MANDTPSYQIPNGNDPTKPFTFLNIHNTIKLTSTNYLSWKIQMEAILIGHDLYKYVDGSLSCPSPVVTTDTIEKTNPEFLYWTRQDKLLFGALVGTLSQTLVPLVSQAHTTKEMWDILAKTYALPSRGHIKQLKDQFNRITKGNRSITEFMQAIKTCADQLAALGKKVEHEDLIDRVLLGLDESYTSVIEAVNGRDTPISFEELHEKLINRELTIQQNRQDSSMPATAFAVTTRNHVFTRKFPNATPPPPPPFQNRYAQSYRKPTPPQAHTATVQIPPSSSTWLLDSGASHHITTDLNNLALHTPYDGTEELIIGDGTAQSAYYCLDPKTNKVYISRHVHFVESKFPFLDLTKPTPSVPTLLEEWCPLSLPISSSVTENSSETILPSHSTPSMDIVSQHSPISSTNSQSQSINSPTNSNTSPSISNEYTSASHSPAISPSSTPSVLHQPSHNMTTRLQNGIRKPITKLNLNVQVASPEIEPKSITQALKSPIWRKAMDDEIAALVRNKTWDLVQPSTSQNVIGCKWVFRIKRDKDGKITKYKARLVAKGFHQRPGLDYNETFSPVVKPTTVRLILSLAVSQGWSLRQLDINNAFLQGTLTDEVYTMQPPGYKDSEYPKLNKALYGLKQAPRAWANMDESKPVANSSCNSSSTVIKRKGTSRPNSISCVNWKPTILKSDQTRCCLLYADWARDRDDYISTTAYIVYLGKNPISWTSKKQRTRARSSTEAEYRAVANATSELLWLRNLFNELGLQSTSTPVIYCDNAGATYVSANPVFHSKMKHLGLDYHFVRENVQSGKLRVTYISTNDQLADALTRVTYISTNDQLADALTKPLPRSTFTSVVHKIDMMSRIIRRGFCTVTPQPWLFIGLGNPGEIYKTTRQNVGFKMIDAFAKSQGISMDTFHFNALFGKGFVGRFPVLLAKPQTFMNLSGECTGPLAAYYKVPLNRVIVFHDDMDLPSGVLHLLPKGCRGKHGGLKSVIRHFGGNTEFARLRIGVGRPPRRTDPKAFMLQNFNATAQGRIDYILQEGAYAMKEVVSQGLTEAARCLKNQQKINQMWLDTMPV
ncbi:hypothetical protein AgCh_004348 [Apium graveolens]